MQKLWRLVPLVAVIALGSDCGGVTPTESDVIVIRVSDSGFDPQEVRTVPHPANISWEWAETNINSHNVTFDTTTGSALTALNSPTQRTGVHGLQFGVAGVFYYWCTVHPEMSGVINVRPDLVF